jgi:NADH-quinone oxidoreductase subunit J
LAESIFFYIFAIAGIISALFVIVNKDPVRSAMSLVVCFLQIAALYVLLRSPFLAVVQVFVYVGAIVVLFLFVVMVLELRQEKVSEYMHLRQKPWAIIIVCALLAEVGFLLFSGWISRGKVGPYSEELLVKLGSTEVLGELLFTKFILPFELVSLLLLVALVGAIVLTLKNKQSKQ